MNAIAVIDADSPEEKFSAKLAKASRGTRGDRRPPRQFAAPHPVGPHIWSAR
jgi:hypothetical protein